MHGFVGFALDLLALTRRIFRCLAQTTPNQTCVVDCLRDAKHVLPTMTTNCCVQVEEKEVVKEDP